jgi:hypothetical protein
MGTTGFFEVVVLRNVQALYKKNTNHLEGFLCS